MLELQNISYLVDDDNKEILRDINLAFDEKFVAITDRMEVESPPWLRLLLEF